MPGETDGGPLSAWGDLLERMTRELSTDTMEIANLDNQVAIDDANNKMLLAKYQAILNLETRVGPPGLPGPPGPCRARPPRAPWAAGREGRAGQGRAQGRRRRRRPRRTCRTRRPRWASGSSGSRGGGSPGARARARARARAGAPASASTSEAREGQRQGAGGVAAPRFSSLAKEALRHTLTRRGAKWFRSNLRLARQCRRVLSRWSTACKDKT